MSSNFSDDLVALREVMGTASQQKAETQTQFVRGGEEIKVTMISPQPLTNFYRGMFVMATSTWGNVKSSGVDKWSNATPAARRQVIKAIMTRKALPLALEHPVFLFEISGCSRSAFDQIARARIGTTFASMGVRDNAHPDIDFVVPPHIYDNPRALADLEAAVVHGKATYSRLLDQGQMSWQDARAVLPMGMMHRFCISINYAALSSLMGKRLQFCEQYDTVAVAWKIRQELMNHYAVFAEALRPSCDFARRCTYHEANSLGEAFGALFRGCGRWEDPEPAYQFNESAADVDDIEKWLGEIVPKGEDGIDWDLAFKMDNHFFTESSDEG